jgi:hypothetical protein
MATNLIESTDGALEFCLSAFLANERMEDFQDSVANSGLENIGQITWENAKNAAVRYTVVTDETRDRLIDWLDEFGAWDREDMEEWPDVELAGLMLQFFAGWLIELQQADSIQAYERDQKEGQVDEYLYLNGGQVFASLDA